MASALALFTLASFAMAQTTTINVPFLGYDDFNFAVSIVGADSTATTMSLACPTGTEESDCGVFPYHTLIYGPSTYKMDMSVPGDSFTMTQDCSMAASSAVCKESASGSEANFPGSSTETYEGSMAPSNAPVTVTAGAEKLTAGASAAPSTSATPTAAASSASGPAATNGTTLSTSGTPTGSGSAPQSTGAASILSSGLPLALSALFAVLLL